MFPSTRSRRSRKLHPGVGSQAHIRKTKSRWKCVCCRSKCPRSSAADYDALRSISTTLQRHATIPTKPGSKEYVDKRRRRDVPATVGSRGSRDPTPRTNCNAIQIATDLDMVLDGHAATALVDTGADYSVMSGPFATQLNKVMTAWGGPHIRMEET